MRILRCLAVVCVVTVVAVVASAGGHDEALMEEVKALGDALTKAMLENDVDFLLGTYAEDAISLPNYGPRMQGMEAFKQHHEMMAGAGLKVRSFESEPTEVWECGDQVIEIGTFEIALDMPGMPNITDEGKYLTVYVRDEAGALKIKAEIWNTDHNPMEMGAGGHEHGEH